MRIDRLFLSLTMIFTGLLGCHRPPAAHPPEVLIYTAREIVTLDENRPSVEAVAIEGDRIIATGGLD
jgi:hypothetical protein